MIDDPLIESRVILMEDHILIRPDGSLLFGRQTSKLSLWDAVFHEDDSTLISDWVKCKNINMRSLSLTLS